MPILPFIYCHCRTHLDDCNVRIFTLKQSHRRTHSTEHTNSSTTTEALRCNNLIYNNGAWEAKKWPVPPYFCFVFVFFYLSVSVGCKFLFIRLLIFFLFLVGWVVMFIPHQRNDRLLIPMCSSQLRSYAYLPRYAAWCFLLSSRHFSHWSDNWQ